VSPAFCCQLDWGGQRITSIVYFVGIPARMNGSAVEKGHCCLTSRWNQKAKNGVI
jgi:hypothetical protein